MIRRTLLTLALLSSANLFAAVQYPKQLGQSLDATAPYDLIGQLLFSSGNIDYVGSGTVIGASSVLTAGHNVYDADTGWSTDLQFNRAAYGNNGLSSQYARHTYLLSGYRQTTDYYGPDDVRSFAYDSAGLTFAAPVAGGAHAGWSTNTAYLANTYYRVAVGYGAEGVHTGDYPLFVTPTTGFYRTYGSFFENTSIYFEGGMSGGPMLSRAANGTYYVTGVIVSSASHPIAGGIRVIDSRTASLINVYLH